VTIAPTEKKSFDINFCAENVLYNLRKKYIFLIFFTLGTLYEIYTAKHKHNEQLFG